VGKTDITALIAGQLRQRGQRVGAYKPACSGVQSDERGEPVWHDVEVLAKATGGDRDRISPQRFVAPLAPTVAARLEGRIVDAALLRAGAEWWSGKVDVLLVEGVGGLLCPLAERETVADLAADLGFPLLIVSRLGLGTLNHTMLTLEAARHRGLKVAGVILNEGSVPVSAVEASTNPLELAARCTCPLLGIVKHNGAAIVRDGAEVQIDWMAMASTFRESGPGLSQRDDPEFEIEV
jgi:dethiobiotin synthetase